MKATGIAKSHRCTKSKRPSAECKACGPMFRGIDKNGNHVPRGHKDFELDTHDITAAVRRVVQKIGGNPIYFSSRSLRRGCISAGTNANVLVPEYVIHLQTGHAPPGQRGQPAGQRYMCINNPKVLFFLWEQFEL
eukprot:747014-Rhodomonas_salina.1